MHVSIVMPVYDKPAYLDQVLASIRSQRPILPNRTKLSYEIIVCNDGPDEEQIRRVCSQHYVDRVLSSGNVRYRSPSQAWNMGYRAARGTVIISQGGDVVHANEHCITRLNSLMRSGHYIVGTVFNVRGPHRLITHVCTAPDKRGRSGCLQAIWRKDIYAIGGLEETLPEHGYDEHFRAICLHAHGVKPIFTTEAVGFHLDHDRPFYTKDKSAISRKAMRARMTQCKAEDIPATATGGPWEWKE